MSSANKCRHFTLNSVTSKLQTPELTRLLKKYILSWFLMKEGWPYAHLFEIQRKIGSVIISVFIFLAGYPSQSTVYWFDSCVVQPHRSYRIIVSTREPITAHHYPKCDFHYPSTEICDFRWEKSDPILFTRIPKMLLLQHVICGRNASSKPRNSEESFLSAENIPPSLNFQKSPVTQSLIFENMNRTSRKAKERITL